MPAKPLPSWFRHLDLPSSILVLLASHQSRYLRVLVDKLGHRWSKLQIECAADALMARGSIELDSPHVYRVRLTSQGRCESGRARERAQKLEKRAAA